MQSGLGKSTPVRPPLVASAALAVGLAFIPSAGMATPDPSIDQVRARVDASFEAAEKASERYNTIVEEMKKTRGEVKTLRSDVAHERRAFTRLRTQVGSTIADELTSSPMGPTAQLLSTSDPDEFLDSLSALQSYNDTQGDALTSFEDKAAELRTREAQLRSKVESMASARQDAAKEKQALDDKAAEAKSLLARLTAEQRKQVAKAPPTQAAPTQAAPTQTTPTQTTPTQTTPTQTTPTQTTPTQTTPTQTTPTQTTPTHATPTHATPAAPAADASGRAGAAIAFAMAQNGEPYVYGAAGPSSWDCSGLTMMAWRAGGVSLPHSSTMQAGYGTEVPTSQMQPGDLVFYYSPISHVGIYLGNGKLIHAPNPSATVEIVPVNSMPITTVRRVG